MLMDRSNAGVSASSPFAQSALRSVLCRAGTPAHAAGSRSSTGFCSRFGRLFVAQFGFGRLAQLTCAVLTQHNPHVLVKHVLQKQVHTVSHVDVELQTHHHSGMHGSEHCVLVLLAHDFHYQLLSTPRVADQHASGTFKEFQHAEEPQFLRIATNCALIALCANCRSVSLSFAGRLTKLLGVVYVCWQLLLHRGSPLPVTVRLYSIKQCRN